MSKRSFNLKKTELLLFFFAITIGELFGQNVTNTISQFGITWTFDKNYTYGQFINGDYWVVGPVKVIDINPKSVITSGRTINGSMLNPEINWSQGYDNWMLGRENGGWNASLNVGRPNGLDISTSNSLTISTGSLVSSISYPNIQSAKNSRVMAVLTILNAAPPADAFRPPYVGSDKSIRHTFSEVTVSLLPNLDLPPQNPSYSLETQNILSHLEKPWIEHMLNYEKENFCAPDNMPAYGRDIASLIGNAACQLMLSINSTDKQLLLIRMLQIGLDNYGILKVPNGNITWEADGGHMCGRAFPILFAGYMFDDVNMLNVMNKSGLYAYQNGYSAGNHPTDYIHFGEQDQTFYVTQQAVDITHGVGSILWAPDARSTAVPFTTSDIGKAMWGVRHVSSPGEDNNNPHHIYLEVNLPSWPGHILASLILGIKDKWNNPALFDYVDDFVVRAMASTEYDSRGFYNNLTKAMWLKYRNNLPTSIDHSLEQLNNLPTQMNLYQNYPNPFDQTTSIMFSIAKPALTTLKVFDIYGSEVAILVNETKGAGSYHVEFDAAHIEDGMYLCELQSGEFRLVKKLIKVQRK